MELELDKVTRRRRLSRISEDVDHVEVRLESCLNVEPSVSPLLGTLEVEAQLEKEATPSKLSDETSSETDTLREGIPIEIDRDIGVDTPITIAQGGGRILSIPPVPPIDLIDSLVRPRNLPIVVP